MMWNSKVVLLWCGVLHAVLATEMQNFEKHTEHNFEHHSEVNVESDSVRGRRGVIEEEKYYNMNTHEKNSNNLNHPWIPSPLPPEDDPTTKISLTNEVKEVLPFYQTTERVTDKPTGRGARASNENWIKLPLPGREDVQRDQRDDILTPPQPSGDLINSRMPRVNFVTQNKPLETSESRNDKESIQRSTRTDDQLRTEFVRPDEDRDRGKYKPVYPRQAVYNQPISEESRKLFYNDRYYSAPDEFYRPEPYYEQRRFQPYYSPRFGIDRYDDARDNYVPRKPKRIIYYAHLPEVVRTPPSVDLRYRYTGDAYRRYEDDMYARNGRYDYRFRNRYPYGYLRKDDRNYRDLAGAGTVNKDKKVEDKVTPTPILPQKEKKNNTPDRNLINSHQYHDTADSYDPIAHKTFHDDVRPDYFRFDEPLLQGPVIDPYHRNY